jgi:serine phosphatase RsbU (regulator of sigma subunit)
VGEIAAHAIGFSACSVVISTRDRDDLMMPPAQDPEREHAYRRLWAHERQLAGPVLEDEPLLVPDLERYRGTEMGSGLSEDVDSVLMIPMHEGDRLRGVLVLECVDDRKALGDTERAFARATVQTISVALESASLFKQAAQRAENLETVFRISQAVSLSLQSSVVLDRVLDVVQKILTADGVALLRFDPHQDAMTTAMARGLRDRSLLDLVLEPGQDVPGAVFESKEPVRIDDVTRVDTPVSHMLQAQGFRSWLAVPLIARGRSIGVLNAFSDHTGAFREEDVDLMATFASQGALAIDTAELFGREHRIASVLQSSIIPGRLPEIPGMRFASEYEAASAEAEIGGDYYDVFRAPDGRVVLAVGDVCGKGVDAATRTSMIKYTLRGLVAAGLEPAVALEELNTAVAEMGNIADIVTMWVAYVDPETGRMTYVNGGHPPAFLLLPDGEVEALEPTGPILGAVVAAEYGQDTRTVADGSTLLIYTDGVTEARTDGELFGEARVRGVLEAGGEPEEIVTRLLEAVRRYTDGSLRDDVAVLAVRLERSVTRED